MITSLRLQRQDRQIRVIFLSIALMMASSTMMEIHASPKGPVNPPRSGEKLLTPLEKAQARTAAAKKGLAEADVKLETAKANEAEAVHRAKFKSTLTALKAQETPPSKPLKPTSTASSSLSLGKAEPATVPVARSTMGIDFGGFLSRSATSAFNTGKAAVQGVDRGIASAAKYVTGQGKGTTAAKKPNSSNATLETTSNPLQNQTSVKPIAPPKPPRKDAAAQGRARGKSEKNSSKKKSTTSQELPEIVHNPDGTIASTSVIGDINRSKTIFQNNKPTERITHNNQDNNITGKEIFNPDGTYTSVNPLDGTITETGTYKVDKNYNITTTPNYFTFSQPAVKSQQIIDAYKTLGLEPNATKREITVAHRKLALQNHPDKGGDQQILQKINEAKELLKNNLTAPQKPPRKTVAEATMQTAAQRGDNANTNSSPLLISN